MTYLLELFNIDVQLVSEFPLCLGKGGYLSSQILRLLGLGLRFLLLLLVARQVELNFAFFRLHQRVVV